MYVLALPEGVHDDASRHRFPARGERFGVISERVIRPPLPGHVVVALLVSQKQAAGQVLVPGIGPGQALVRRAGKSDVDADAATLGGFRVQANLDVEVSALVFEAVVRDQAGRLPGVHLPGQGVVDQVERLAEHDRVFHGLVEQGERCFRVERVERLYRGELEDAFVRPALLEDLLEHGQCLRVRTLAEVEQFFEGCTVLVVRRVGVAALGKGREVRLGKGFAGVSRRLIR